MNDDVKGGLKALLRLLGELFGYYGRKLFAIFGFGPFAKKKNREPILPIGRHPDHPDIVMFNPPPPRRQFHEK